MHVEFLQLKHVLHFPEISLKLNYTKSPMTLIMGDQGSGKSALLRFCYQALTWFPARQRDIRTAGLVMLDQDIMQNRLQSKIDIHVNFPEEIGSFVEASDRSLLSQQRCTWQMYKTLNAQGIGLSKVETQQLEDMVNIYNRAIKRDPLLGLPLIAYYPAERFVNDINLLSKNNLAIFQPAHAYELTAIPFTTFARFFEWFREISDIENAQSAKIIKQLLEQQSNLNTESHDVFSEQLAIAKAQVHAPSLNALRCALSIVIPELSEIYLTYSPKLQLMVRYQDQDLLLQQLPNSIRNWIALVGDIVRRLCILNPYSLFPCQEGTGILMIDAIDHQLDQDHCNTIIHRLHQAFPRLQIIATGNRIELLEQAQDFQCLKLENKKLELIDLSAQQIHFDQVYADLGMQRDKELIETKPELIEPSMHLEPIETILNAIQNQLSTEQQQALIQQLSENHQNQLGG